MLIALTGFMGSGKSTVGRLLADSLGCVHIDLDREIVRNAGRSIPDIFAEDDPRFIICQLNTVVRQRRMLKMIEEQVCD